MTNTERYVEEIFLSQGIDEKDILYQPILPISVPWSSKRPVADFLLWDKVYVEVKGLMTIEKILQILAISNKCRGNSISYVLIQATEYDWATNVISESFPTKKEKMHRSVIEQIKQVAYLKDKNNSPYEFHQLLLSYMKSYVNTKNKLYGELFNLRFEEIS